jgi:hypothetical protein
MNISKDYDSQAAQYDENVRNTFFPANNLKYLNKQRYGRLLYGK